MGAFSLIVVINLLNRIQMSQSRSQQNGSNNYSSNSNRDQHHPASVVTPSSQGDVASSSSVIVEDWEDLGSSSASTRMSANQAGGGNATSTMGSLDSEIMSSVSNMTTSAASAMSVSNATSSSSPYADELERLLMEAQREGSSSRATSVRSSSGPHSPVWSTGGTGTGFNSPVFLQNSANQTKLESALANYSSRPECTPMKPHELAEKFRHPNGDHELNPAMPTQLDQEFGREGGGGGVIFVSEVGREHNGRYRSSRYQLHLSDDESETEPPKDEFVNWVRSFSSSFRTVFTPPYSYVSIPTHLIMFGLGALCAYICFAKKVFKKWR